LRGGGGNFGVATSFEFALHPQGDVLAGFTVYPIEKTRDVLAFYRELTATAPEQLTVYVEIVRDPESGERVIALAFCWPDDPADGERALAPLRAFDAPLLEMIEVMPYRGWQQAFEHEFPHGRRYYWKGSLMRRLDDDVLDAVTRHAVAPPAPWPMVAIEGYRGPMNRIDPAATAFPHRSAEYQVVVVGATDDPAEDETITAWTRGLHAALEPYALNGGFLNFNSFDGGERPSRIRAGYGANWDRLVAVKRRYDPDNLFHENNNIPSHS
jgi:FAD/FMN-containing dehydrogenase